MDFKFWFWHFLEFLQEKLEPFSFVMFRIRREKSYLKERRYSEENSFDNWT